jgi:bifunctional non-homologous end joining protein LigD
VRVAFWLRAIFDHLGLQSFAKTTGSKGLQVYVPLNTPVTYDETKYLPKRWRNSSRASIRTKWSMT